jgi:hypothetical protein
LVFVTACWADVGWVIGSGPIPNAHGHRTGNRIFFRTLVF